MICRFFSELVFVWVVKKDPRKVRAMTQNYSMSCFLAAGREFAQNLQNRLSLEESFFKKQLTFNRIRQVREGIFSEIIGLIRIIH